MKYTLLYRLGLRPWERYAPVAAEHLATLLDREERERVAGPGRALDLGCGRGLHTAVLARRGWSTVGVDAVPQAVEAARAQGDGATYVVGDVTDLGSADLGTFDLFLDAGCFQGLGADQRAAEGREVTALAAPGATLLLLAFQAGPWRALVEGVSREDVVAAFPGWDVVSVEPADTRRLGWPMNRTSPLWYRLHRPT